MPWCTYDGDQKTETACRSPPSAGTQLRSAVQWLPACFLWLEGSGLSHIRLRSPVLLSPSIHPLLPSHLEESAA